MEVHPPEHAIHSWRDFFVHIATIVVGLLIAIGLEQTVEAMHHHHQREVAEHNLRLELEENHRLLAEDETQLKASAAFLRSAMLRLESMRLHKPPQGELARSSIQWNGMSMTAWNTAQSTGATSLLPFEDAGHYADLYEQQRLINEQGTRYFRIAYQIASPLSFGRSLEVLSPEEVQRMESNIELSMAELGNLLDLCHSLDTTYADTMRKLP